MSSLQEKLERCKLDINKALSPKLLAELGGEVTATIIPVNARGRVYLWKKATHDYRLPSDVTLKVGNCLAEVPKLSGLSVAGVSKVSGMVRRPGGVHILMTYHVLVSPFAASEEVDSPPLLQGLCHGHPWVDYLPQAAGLH